MIIETMRHGIGGCDAADLPRIIQRKRRKGLARRFTGAEEAPVIAARLLRCGPRAVILTLGEQGSFALTAEGESYSLPAFRVEVADTTGAGDAFHGGLLFALRRGYPLRRAVQVASAVAALSCTRLGGQSGLARLEELEDFRARQGLPLE